MPFYFVLLIFLADVSSANDPYLFHLSLLILYCLFFLQPFPQQTSSLFGVPPTPLNGFSGLIPSGDPSRNVNIHIHAGKKAIFVWLFIFAQANLFGYSGNPFSPGVSNAAPRANSGEPVQGERSNAQQATGNDTGTGGSAPNRGLPPRTVVAAIPARPTTQTSGQVLSVIYPIHIRTQISASNPTSAQVPNPTLSSGAQATHTGVPPPSLESGALSNIVAQISAQVANMLTGGAQGFGPSSQGLQSTDAQDSQIQSAVASQVNQTSVDVSTVSGSAQGRNESFAMQSTDSSCMEEHQQAQPGE